MANRGLGNKERLWVCSEWRLLAWRIWSQAIQKTTSFVLGLGNIFVLPGLELKLLLFSRSIMSNSAIPWTTACQASLSFAISQSLFKLMTIELMMPFNHLILCHPLLLLPSIFLRIRVFSNESALHIRWTKLQLQHQYFQWIFRVDFL